MGLKIKFIKEFSYAAIYKFGKLTKGERQREGYNNFDTYSEFDKNGNLIKDGIYDTEYYATCCPNITYSTRYNLQGKLIEEHDTSFRDFWDNICVNVILYTYNEIGNLFEKKTYELIEPKFSLRWVEMLDKDGWIKKENHNELFSFFTGKEVNKYNKQGELIERRAYNPNNTYDGEEIFKYDIKGNRVGYTLYNSKSEIEVKYTSVFDDKSRRLEEKRYDAENIFIGKTLFIRDGLGRVIEIKEYNGDSKLVNSEIHNFDEIGGVQIEKDRIKDCENHHCKVCKYNSSDLLIEDVSYKSDGSVYSKRTNVIDSNDNIIESKWIEFADEFICTSSIYEYDEHKNWIKRIDLNKDIPEYIIEREIEYF